MVNAGKLKTANFWMKVVVFTVIKKAVKRRNGETVKMGNVTSGQTAKYKGNIINVYQGHGETA